MDRNDLREFELGLAACVRSLIETMAMQAENQNRLQRGESIAYTEKQFEEVMERNAIFDNAILQRWAQ